MKRYDICSHGGEYHKDGDTKVRWINHGAIFEKDGKFSMKLDSYPVGGEGWFKLFPAKQKSQRPSAPPPADDFDDSIPF